MEPKIGRFPIEVFGTNYCDNSSNAKKQREKQHCPYTNRECTKPRKSEPHIKVGICSLGCKNFFDDTFQPNIICPNRFLKDDDVVFSTIKTRFFPTWDHVRWVKEVSLGVGGNVDFVAVKTNPSGSSVEDFLCVEFQANGTTGSPYGFVKDLLNDGEYTKTYTYGFNWANEFVKTMMQQVYKKGTILSTWGRKIVFVIQDQAMDYLDLHVDTSDLREDMDDPVHFLMFRLNWHDEKNRFLLEPAGWKSATLDAINKILAGANEKDFLTPNEFKENIRAKGRTDGVLK